MQVPSTFNVTSTESKDFDHLNSPQRKCSMDTLSSNESISIPESIRNSYLQQQLPPRNQSLSTHSKLLQHANLSHIHKPLYRSNTDPSRISTPIPSHTRGRGSESGIIAFIQNNAREFKGGHKKSLSSESRRSTSPDSFLPPNGSHDSGHAKIPPRLLTPSVSEQPLGTRGSALLKYVQKALPWHPSEPPGESNYRSRMSDSSESSVSRPERSVTLRTCLPVRRLASNTSQRSTDERSKSDAPLIYCALLSRVASQLLLRVEVSTIVHDSIEHHRAFTGKHVIDVLVDILHTNDRNLALLVGRALDSQNFLHDVTYEHRLRDSSSNIYRLREQADVLGLDSSSNSDFDYDTGKRMTSDMSDIDSADTASAHDTEPKLPNGVFTLLTECYSPTCSRKRPCYSINCPRNARKIRSRSKKAKHDNEEDGEKDERKLWIHSVPKDIVAKTSPEERERQECIYELIHTEIAFVQDLQYIHKYWVMPLISSPDIIPEDRREHFVQEVFWNVNDIEKVNSGLAKALIERQKHSFIVSHIGDILLESVPQFSPFVVYGAHQIIGKFKLELERRRNPVFATFVEETERLPRSRRLELNGFLTKPTTRLGRYNLLLRQILKRTPADNPDVETIPKVMAMITQFLVKVNAETGKSENAFELQQLQERLTFKSTLDYVDLKLADPGRELVLKGRMKRKEGSSSDASDLQVFLFDHYLVFTKIKYYDYLEHYRVYRKPIPLDLLSIVSLSTSNHNRIKRASTILPYSRPAPMSTPSIPLSQSSMTDINVQRKPADVAVTFFHHGRDGSPPFTLYCSSHTMRSMWVDTILAQRQKLVSETRIFDTTPLMKRHLLSANRVNSTVLLENSQWGKHLIILGTDHGLFVTDLADSEPYVKRVLTLDKISRVDVLGDSHVLLLAEKTLWLYPMDIVSGDLSILKQGRVVCQNTALYHIGQCMGRTLICAVKTNTLTSTTIRVLEAEMVEEGKKKKSVFGISRSVVYGQGGLKLHKDLYLPCEALGVNLLKSKLCIFCPREIAVVDMQSFNVQTLLDPDDQELDFVFSLPDARPMAIYRTDHSEYFVCYHDFGFFVDRKGRLLRSHQRIEWMASPVTFAMSHPYILVFGNDLIEIRNIMTGEMEQIILGTQIKCTLADQNMIHCTMNDPDNDGFQLVFQLDRLLSPSSPSSHTSTVNSKQP